MNSKQLIACLISILSAACLFCIVVQAQREPRPKQLLEPIRFPIAGTKVTIHSPVTVSTGGMAEATMAIIPPGKLTSCPNGRLFFGSLNVVRPVSLKPLDPPINPIIFDPETPEDPDAAPPQMIYDNHLVVTGDNRLIYTVEGHMWRDDITSRPSWWDVTKDYTTSNKNVPGGRAAIFAFESTDCGNTWTTLPAVDAAKIEVWNPQTKKSEVGYCGQPRIVDEVKKEAWFGGWDGHYLYADRKTGNLFITTPCVGGNKTIGLVLMSSDYARTWKVIRQKETEYFWRVPLSSLSNGVIGFAYLDTLSDKYYMETARPPYEPENFSTPLFLADNSYPSIGNDSTGFFSYVYAYLSIATVKPKTNPTYGSATNERFRISTYADDAGDGIFKIQSVEPRSSLNSHPPNNVIVKDFKDITIKAVNKGNSLMHGTFVGPPSVSDRSIFYWVEQIEKGKFRIKSELNTTGYISDEYATPSFTGDYNSGAAYTDVFGVQHFFLSWSESGSLKFSEITFFESGGGRSTTTRPYGPVIYREKPKLTIEKPIPPDWLKLKGVSKEVMHKKLPMK